MTAVDTNLVVRLLTGDDPKQGALATALFESGPIWIAKTVLLESGWVLRSLYGLSQDEIRDAFNKLLGLKNVHAEDQAAVAAALALTTHGVELADAIHFYSKPSGANFVSLDKYFVRESRRAGVTEVSDLSEGGKS